MTPIVEPGKEFEWNGDERKNRNNPDHSTAKIGSFTKTFLVPQWNLRRKNECFVDNDNVFVSSCF